MLSHRSVRRTGAAIALAGLVGGCSWFGRDRPVSPPKPPPATTTTTALSGSSTTAAAVTTTTAAAVTTTTAPSTTTTAPSTTTTAPSTTTTAPSTTTTAPSTTTTAPSGPRVFFTAPAPGSTVTSPVTLTFDAADFVVEPAGLAREGAGHLHVMIDVPCVAPGAVIPMNDSHVHLGNAQKVLVLALPAGAHTVCLQAGDGIHRALALTEQLTFTVS